MNSLIDIRAITFDAAGTLLFPNPSVGAIYQEVMAAHGLVLEKSKLEHGFRHALRSISKDASISDSEKRERIFWKSVVSSAILYQSQIPQNFEALFAALWDEFAKGARWKLNSEAIHVFDFLDHRAIPFAILTNWDSRVRSVVRDHRIEHRFSHIFISSEIGSEKPEKGIFDFAADSFGISPNRLLHIGDHLEQDVLGARNSGWQSAHLRADSKKGHPDIFPISRLADILPLIDNPS